VLSGSLYDRHVTHRLEALSEVVKDASLYEDLRAVFRQQLDGIQVSLGILHGDFSLSNLLVKDGQLSAIIDWDASSAEDLPILDAIHYLRSAHQWFRSGRMSETVALLAFGNWPVAEEWCFLLERYRKYQMDPAHHQGLVYLYWLRNINMLLPFWLKYDPVGIDSYICAVARMLVDAESGPATG
jgi:thiamine kinase-like enzyme